MEYASSLFTMPRQKTLRDGQRRVVEKALTGVNTVNAQLPTGYGKTFTACCVYAELKKIGRVNRMLYIVPSLTQLNQFVADGSSDLADAGVDGPLDIVNVLTAQHIALRYHRENKYQVFAITVQSLSSGTTGSYVTEMIKTGRWMFVVDEYHHYGLDAHWGRRINQMNYEFRLAMSATPYRPDNDSAFGPPDVVTTYEQAVKQDAVKPLRLHSYVYRIDLIDKTGHVSTYTTSELISEVGSDNPEAIDKFVLDRQMRWSPKYISPLVDAPLARMIQQRITSGYPIQAIVGAMSCLHAEQVCTQMKGMFPELRIDWVGTGPNGRDDKTNTEIIKKFCPPKRNGKRNPEDVTLDVLVHVGMAGEGLDSVYVAEIIHLNQANINNSNHQENGRAARYLKGVTGYINVDSSSPYAEYTGASIMKLIDNPDASPETDEEDAERTRREDTDWFDLPDEPTIRLYDLECIEIDQGELNRFARAALQATGKYSEDQVDHFLEMMNLDHPLSAQFQESVEARYRLMRSKEAQTYNHESTVAQLKQQVHQAHRNLVGKVIKLTKAQPSARHPKDLAGDIAKRINIRKKKELGEIEPDPDVLRKHWNWLVSLDKELKANGIPSWLQ